MDVNSLITSALDSANKRRANAAGINDKLLSNVTKVVDQGYSQISVEDIANAMKARNDKKQVDNTFIERHGKELDERDKNEFDPSIALTSSAVSNTHNKIAEVHNHSEKMMDRQADVFSSLKKSQSNPFAV